MSGHLHLELTGHGYGHLAQTAPVLNALRQRLPTLALSVRSALPRAVLASHIAGAFVHVEQTTDVGMLMASAVDVRVAESAEAYRLLHARRHDEINALLELYARLRPDLVLVNAPWLPLQACRQARLPAMALCSLDWATVLQAYCASEPGIGEVVDAVRDSYAIARPFIRPAPARDDIGFIDALPVGPIARLGRQRRAAIERRFPSLHGQHLVLVALGGIATQLPVAHWPRLADVVYITPGEVPPRREDWMPASRLGMPFIDILRSVDAVITKPGYGTFVEAVCNATRVLYSPRADWPEEPWLSGWLEQHGTARAVDRDALWAGEFSVPLLDLLHRAPREPLSPSGIQQAADVLATRWEQGTTTTAP